MDICIFERVISFSLFRLASVWTDFKVTVCPKGGWKDAIWEGCNVFISQEHTTHSSHASSSVGVNVSADCSSRMTGYTGGLGLGYTVHSGTT